MRHKYYVFAVIVLGLIGRLAADTRLAPAQTTADLFDVGRLQELHLFVNSKDLSELRAGSAENIFFPADLAWRDTRVRNVGVRAREFGSRDPDKPGLLIDFSRYTTSQKFVGLGTLVLDSLSRDPSMIREHVRMAFKARMGQPASRESFCRLYINNVYQGLYAVVENVDRDYLTRTFGESQGYLFEYHGGFVPSAMIPADTAAYRSTFQPLTHILDADETLFGPIRDLFREADGPNDAVWRARVERYVDLKQLVTDLATDVFLSGWATFTRTRGMGHFYLYRGPGTTVHRILPSDEADTMTSIDSPIFFGGEDNALVRRALQFSDVRARYLDELDRCVQKATEDGWLEAEVARGTAVVATAAREDVRKPFTNEQFDAGSQFLAEYARLRPAFVAQEVRTARAASEGAEIALRTSVAGTTGATTMITASTDPRSRDRNGREVSGVATGRDGSTSGSTSGLPLVRQQDLTYLGAFRFPAGSSDTDSFNYGGTALAYWPAHNSLLAVGHDWYQLVAELTIPAITTPGAINGLATAGLAQRLTDVLAGKLYTVDGGTGNGVKIGGLLPTGNGLIVSAWDYYDGGGTQSLSHFKTGLNFSNLGAVAGPVRVGNGQAGFVSGYMTPIPTEWQAQLGGSALTGQCCIPIITRTSAGPSVSVFDPANVGVISPIPATRVLGYPDGHWTIGAWDSTGTLFNSAGNVGGVIFPAGTRSVLFFGQHGIGQFCYGEGTSDQALHLKPIPAFPTDHYCYDPTDDSKGNHSYPYVHFVWAYDAKDLVAVKAGSKNPWDVQPYATWAFDVPFQVPGRQIMGAAYDPATQRLFLSMGFQDGGAPLVQVFTIRVGATATSVGR